LDSSQAHSTEVRIGKFPYLHTDKYKKQVAAAVAAAVVVELGN
jgi:hypothetical protein